jgi:hypothetical protein
MPTSLVIHGHFYQPPRENPWTDQVEREPSARPFHDWNERIHAECYRANAFARIFDAQGRIQRIVNNYAHISFNFGPTLASWLETHHPETYRRILQADAESLRRLGHGNAIAQGYNHSILPLCNERDRRTQIRWGIADFAWRFGRKPESLWLPETACDEATLDSLIDENLKFVILAPNQAGRVRAIGTEAWRTLTHDNIDTSIPYNFHHRDGSGRSIAIFFYDGRIAKGIAFDGLLRSSVAFIDAFERAALGGAQIVHAATDGESYGHHFRFGDLCLAHALEIEARRDALHVTNYGEFLEHHAPRFEVELRKGPAGEATAWSCAHGVGRWSRDCGCNTGAHSGWNQKWRTPLRTALDLLRDDAARKFEDVGGELLRDPWLARDDYITLILDHSITPEDFLARHEIRALDESERDRAIRLLEIQRAAMTMYTSCGWFFDNIAGLEAVQILRYAGRVLEMMDALKLSPPIDQFLAVLAEARSNDPLNGTGVDILRRAVSASSAARRPSHRPERPGVKSVFEDTLNSSLRSYLSSPNVEDYYSALTLISLGKKLKLHRSLDRAQEIVYEALRAGQPSDELRELAFRLGFSDILFSSGNLLIADTQKSETVGRPPGN